MPCHFSVNLHNSKYGLKISRDKYAIIDNRSSLIHGKIYPDRWCKEHLKRCLTNYDLNMEYFSLLDKNEFDHELDKFIIKNHFTEVFDLNKYKNIAGYYVLVLDKYCQIYIGTTSDIKRRIMTHWSNRKSFDRLIFGNVNNSFLSIDSFRALDTTRIFVYKENKTFINEDGYINDFPLKFMLNRTGGGKLEDGLTGAIIERKTRDLKRLKKR